MSDSVSELITQVSNASDRFISTARKLSDEQVREPSLLPRWNRGHVLTHIARNADGLGNLLSWAKTGVRTPQYPSQEARDAEIEAGSGRTAAELAEDVAVTSRSFIELAGSLDGDAWLAQVQGLRGAPHPAWMTLRRRLFELEVHHADLAADYKPADWPGWFVTEQLGRIAADMVADDTGPAALLVDADTSIPYALQHDETTEMSIAGPGHLLLAWLLGRSDGTGLVPDPPGPLPEVPPY